MLDLHSTLRDANIVAIVGCSNDSYRASNHAAKTLVESGYTVIPVNPKYEEVIGIACYSDFELIPDDISIDIVNIFRNPTQTLGAIEAVIARSERTRRKPIIWTQPGVSSPDAERAAILAGFEYVQNRCIMTELASMPDPRRSTFDP